MESRISRAVKYRNKAEEVRVVTEGVRDLGVKTLLSSVAKDYEMIAEVLEKVASADDIPAPAPL